MCAKTLKSFARKQASEEQTETDTTETTTEETGSTEETELTEETEPTETDTTETTASATVLKAGQVAINASDLKKLKADADAWNKNKGQFATLTDWHKSMQDAGANVPGKEDTSTQHDKTDSSVSDQPWNKKASEAYGKSVKKV